MSLYGLKQASKLGFNGLHRILLGLVFLIVDVIYWLHKEFAMTDLGPLNYFLGISVTRDSSGLFLSQKKYAIEILDGADMVNCNPSQTPIDTESKLGSDGDPVFDPTLYRSLAGALFSALKRILRYVHDTLEYGLQLFSSSTADLVAYSDADWAGCPTTRYSTSGYCVFLGNNLLSWSSKRQPTLFRSSGKAEYRDVANAVAETCWLRNLLRELDTPLSSATLIHYDNVSAVYLSCNPFSINKEERVRLLVGSLGASTTPIYSLGSSSTTIYSPGSSTPPRYTPGASTPQSYSLGTSRNVECSNCKHLLDKITVLEATVDMYMHPEQHTVNSAALFHDVYSNMGNLDLE
nr:ribonuclease H-like domain-containing protein [Tanacetum cinerariifolium]